MESIYRLYNLLSVLFIYSWLQWECTYGQDILDISHTYLKVKWSSSRISTQGHNFEYNALVRENYYIMIKPYLPDSFCFLFLQTRLYSGSFWVYHVSKLLCRNILINRICNSAGAAMQCCQANMHFILTARVSKTENIS
jgi:hypothetical protein